MSLDPKSTYYDVGGIETIDILRAKLTEDEFRGYCKGNAIKYLSRAAWKHDDQSRDLEKAFHYLKLLQDQTKTQETLSRSTIELGGTSIPLNPTGDAS